MMDQRIQVSQQIEQSKSLGNPFYTVELERVIITNIQMDCNVCSQRYTIFDNKAPIVLGCGHSVCNQCLETLLIQNCPACRSPIESKSKNYSLLQMIEKTQAGTQTPKKASKKNIEELFKISIVGESSVGKTTILHMITKGEFNSNTIPTVGVDFTYIDREIEGKIYRFQLWDTAGQEQYRCIAKNHYLNSDVIILAYSVDDHHSFQQLKNYWIKEIQLVAPEAKLVFVGNKADLEAAVSASEVDQCAKKHNTKHYRVSCKNKTGVLTVWQNIVYYLFKTRDQKPEKKQKSALKLSPSQPQKRSFFDKLRDCWANIF